MNERRERDKPVFGVASMTELSGFRDNETGDARANVQSPIGSLVLLPCRYNFECREGQSMFFSAFIFKLFKLSQR